jgi:hypothetical protein
MTDYEIVSLFHEVITGVNASLTNYLTVLLAMLVASHLAAHRLDRGAATVALLIYSVFSLGMINEIHAGYRDFAAIGMEMARVGGLPGSTIGWHPTVANGGAGLTAIPKVILGILLGSYVASMWFFFHARRTHAVEPAAGA